MPSPCPPLQATRPAHGGRADAARRQDAESHHVIAEPVGRRIGEGRAEMRDELMAEDVEIDPTSGQALFGAAKAGEMAGRERSGSRYRSGAR